MSLEELLEFAGEKAELRKDPAKRRQMQREKMKSAYEPTSYDREAAATRAKIARLKKLLTQAKKRQNRRAVAAIQSRLKELNTSLKHIPTRINPGLVRASELQSPAPVGHFLREFGQSDRDQIENANSEPAVTQVLALMNGQIEKTIISNPRTVLIMSSTRQISKARSTRFTSACLAANRPDQKSKCGLMPQQVKSIRRRLI